MNAPAAFEIKEGDLLKWKFPSGLKDEGTVIAVRSYRDEGVSVYVDHMMKKGSAHPIGVYLRHVRLDWLTHYNGRRLDQDRTRSRQKEETQVELLPEAGAEQIRLQGEEPIVATKKKATATKPKATKKAAKSGMRTSHRKSLDDMSQAHRDHIEKWEPHLEQLQSEGVWGCAMRVQGRGMEGPAYIAIKRGPKDYAIVSYDTAKRYKVTARFVLEDGFETSTALLEAFKPYRLQAREERDESKAKPTKPKPKAKPKPKPKPKPKATRKPKPKPAKKPVRKAAPKRTAKK